MEDIVNAQIEVARWMGRRQAFGHTAGQCSAAEIESISRIRGSKLYANLNCTWDEYCVNYLHIPRRTVDRLIGYFHRFGRAFFTIRQLTQITVADYRCIVGEITEHGLNFAGKVIALEPENTGEIAAAVKTLLQNRPPKPGGPPPFGGVLSRVRGACRSLSAFQGDLTGEDRAALARELDALVAAARTWGITLQ